MNLMLAKYFSVCCAVGNHGRWVWARISRPLSSPRAEKSSQGTSLEKCVRLCFRTNDSRVPARQLGNDAAVGDVQRFGKRRHPSGGFFQTVVWNVDSEMVTRIRRGIGSVEGEQRTAGQEGDAVGVFVSKHRTTKCRNRLHLNHPEFMV